MRDLLLTFHLPLLLCNRLDASYLFWAASFAAKNMEITIEIKQIILRTISKLRNELRAFTSKLHESINQKDKVK